MKIKAGKNLVTLGVVLLAVLMTADLSIARMGGGGHRTSSESDRSRHSRRGSDDSYDDRYHRDRERSRDRDHRLAGLPGGAYPMMTSGTLAGEDVLMELEPRGIVDGKLHVRYSATTRSGDLGDYHLPDGCTLEYGDKVIRPVAADPMRGRHAEGVMIFEVDEMPDHFSVILTGFPGENHRVHRW